VIENATGYEQTSAIADPIVVYIQEYDGKVAKKGKHWARDLNDFLKNFVRISFMNLSVGTVRMLSHL